MTYNQVIVFLGRADEYEPEHDIRQMVLDVFRGKRGNPNEWTYSNIRKMSESITHVEDIVELRRDCGNRRDARLTLRAVRRTLECKAND